MYLSARVGVSGDFKYGVVCRFRPSNMYLSARVGVLMTSKYVSIRNSWVQNMWFSGIVGVFDVFYGSKYVVPWNSWCFIGLRICSSVE